MMEKSPSASASAQASTGTKLAATAMAIAGRALRPCDVCGRERAKWYCKADEAYLCEHCDGSVHGANAVSLRHERVRLGPNGMIMKNVRRLTKPDSQSDEDKDTSGPATTTSTSNDHRYVGFRKRPRSSRPHPSLSSSRGVKSEPESPKENLVSSPDHERNHDEEELSRQVPVFSEDLASSDDNNSLGFSVPCAAPNNDDDEDMCFTLSAGCDLDGFLDAEADLCDMDGIMSGTITMEDIGDLEGVILSPESKVFTNESFGIDFPEMTFRNSCSNGQSEVEGCCDTPDGAMSSFCPPLKVKVEESEELDKIKLEVDEMLGFAFSTGGVGAVKEEEVERKITLKLNYEDVLNAWSDRGPFWTEGPRPQSVPDDSSFDPASALDSGLVPDYCMESTQPETLGQVPVVNFGGDERMIAARGGREARVMRYREKRRTRLFSKKIRYEVRKLNAERRPRLKGRFVKRTACN